jgi:hypothetical protein
MEVDGENPAIRPQEKCRMSIFTSTPGMNASDPRSGAYFFSC